MPAIQVARTDTFEQQRQKINQIGSSLFNITAGGSDLSTGNLKLGDGSVSAPSLSFVSDVNLGIYKSGIGKIGFAADQKRVLDASASSIDSFKDVNLYKTSVLNANVLISNSGQNYSTGTFSNISLTGGTGSDATATISVVGFTGTVAIGTGYTAGSYSGVALSGGSGAGALVSFTVPALQGNITAAGTGYTAGLYTSVPLTNVSGSGSGATATITVSGTQVIGVVINSSGSGYVTGDILSASNTNLGGAGSGFQYTVSNNPGRITSVTFSNRGSGYSVGNVLTLPGPINGITTTLQASVNNVSATLGSGSQITVSDTSGILAGYTVTKVSGTGQIDSATTVQSVDGPTTLTLSSAPIQSGSAVLIFSPVNPNQITIASSTGIRVGDVVTVTAGAGVLPSNTTVVSISGNTITLSQSPTTGGSSTLRFSPAYGSGTGFSYTISKLGAVDSVLITSGGTGYTNNDILSVSPSDLVSPIESYLDVIYVQQVTFTGTVSTSAFSVGSSLQLLSGGPTYTVRKINSSGGNITSILLDNASLVGAEELIVSGNINTTYTVNTASTAFYLYRINNGSTTDITPNLTFYVGSKYRFYFTDSSNTGHTFAFSKFRDGKWSPSRVSSLSATIVAGSSTITVSDTTGIQPGMTVEQISGSGLISTTTVLTVPNLTTFTVETPATTSGSPVLDVYGSEYTDGVTRTSTYLEINVLETSPSTLYYYCQGHPNMAGSDNNEATITVNPVNPNPVGSGFELSIGNVETNRIIYFDISTGEINSSSITSTTGTISTLSSTNITSSLNVTTPFLSTNTVSSTGSLSIAGATSVSFTTPSISFGSNTTLVTTSGNLTTSGVIKTTSELNVNDVLKISNNNIQSVGANDVLISPSSGRLAKVSSSTAFVIPSGNTSQRPSALAQSGAIRFNTDTNQYEGYSGTTSSWSSLGGVRDLDGNTYITAELTIGSNDNTLWFYNDNINTVKFTPEYQEFVNVKKVRSVNVSAPSYANWTANTPVSTGQYLKYRNNIYEVVTGGVTGTSGNEPTSTTGTNFTNGTATLKFSISAVSPLTFEEISEVLIAPLGGTSLVINDELSLFSNVISTKVNDLLIQPNTGKKVTISAPTSLVIPVGTSNERGNAAAGSIRFNTTILQYEGYDGTNWSSLGGVRDVDGNTYIIPELSAGSNENILYFYNNGSNTLRVTQNEIQLDSIDTISSTTSNTLNLDAQLITFNSLAASIDTSSNRTFISTTRDNLDLGLSSGLANDPLLRLSDTGDIYYNLGFGSGVYNGVKIFDNELKELEIADYKISTTKVDLVRNTINTGSAILYDPALHTSAKVQIIAHNETTGDKEFIEYSVIDKGMDIFFTDFGNVKTGAELISCVFDFNASNNVRVTFTLDSAISSGNVIKVTVISNIIKR